MVSTRPRRSTISVSYTAAVLDSEEEEQQMEESDESLSDTSSYGGAKQEEEEQTEDSGSQSEAQSEAESEISGLSERESEMGSDGLASDPDGSGLSEGAVSIASVESDQEEGSEKEEGAEKDLEMKDVKPTKKRATASSGAVRTVASQIDYSLPPISDINEIFEDMVERIQEELEKVAETLAGQKIRVATVCSGTEAPLLAFSQISRALAKLTGGSSQLIMDHVFSCEIVPFKQAFIERNFAPKLLFRDLEDLGNDYAITAYAGEALVPGDLDMLIAGTSCVDFSNLNNKKKGVDGDGESAVTFGGLVGYIVKHKPKVIILENVIGAPWADIKKKFSKINYNTEFVRLDTKKYYLPHTRQRGYLIAVPSKSKSAASIPAAFKRKVESMARPASSSLEAFLLPSDDIILSRAKTKLSMVQVDGAQRATTDWVKCQGRHARARWEEDLGQQRPMTKWKEGGGGATLADGGWQEWLTNQTERVFDLMDCSLLRIAKTGVDVEFKSGIWNLSQNVDRQTDSKQLAICPCLTPSMIPFLTNRGGPIIGREAFALQGLPLNELLLTRETEKQLADLAGNAMSTTAVGSAIAAALILCSSTFEPHPIAEDIVIDAGLSPTERIHRDDRLVEENLDLTSYKPFEATLLQAAVDSARKCTCEGRAGVTTEEIYKCSKCEHSSCIKCSKKPEHDYVKDPTERFKDGIDLDLPATFEKLLKEHLPMRLTIDGFSKIAIAAVMATVEEKKLDLEIDSYVEAITGAFASEEEFHFESLLRRATWTAQFSSPSARLELHFLSGSEAEWRVTVLPDAKLAGNSPLRALLTLPIARLVVNLSSTSLFSGSWEVRIPLKPQAVSISMEIGPLVQSWQKSLGLVGFGDGQRAKTLTITLESGASDLLDRDISGAYELEERCGTATNALHRQVNSIDGRPLYLFLDQSRTGEGKDDFFVFSSDNSRKDYGSVRQIIAQLDKSWRPEITNPTTRKTKVFVCSKWSLIEASVHSTSGSSFYAIPVKALDLILPSSSTVDSCRKAEAVLQGRFPATKVIRDQISTSSEWEEVDLVNAGPKKFKTLAFALARIPELEAMGEWQVIDHEKMEMSCSSCTPTAPSLEWLKSSSGQFIPEENPVEATAFEIALKNRPNPVSFQARTVGESSEFRIGINVAFLTHEALNALPNPTLHDYPVEEPVTTWRLVHASPYDLALSKVGIIPCQFNLTGCEAEVMAVQPPQFNVTLRPEQLKSLTWMINSEIAGEPWLAEEVAEAQLPQNGMYAEAKATQAVSIRGGVLADEVGYGKTAIIVGLICARKVDVEANRAKPQSTQDDRIAVKATLVIVPPHLLRQWPSEIKKFANGLDVISMFNAGDLKKYTVEDIMKADVIVITAKMFDSDAFFEITGDFAAGARAMPGATTKGRYFAHCLDLACGAMGDQVRRLRNEGSGAVFEEIKKVNKERKVALAAAQNRLAASRRNRGAGFVAAREKNGKGKGKANGKAKAKKDEDEDESEAYDSEEEEDIAEEEEEEEVEPVSKKGKTSKPASPPPTSTGGVADRWKLLTSPVKKSWKKMESPPLHMFSFERIVVDEYTYLGTNQIASVMALRASSRWILSGTPPIGSYASINTMASLVHASLGIADDEAEFTGKGAVKGNSSQTKAEQFRSFVVVHTAGWHKRRDGLAQKFLSRFVRQNMATIEAIPCREEVVRIELPAAEMAIYRELEHHLLSLDENLSKIVKVSKTLTGDREVRLAESLGTSKSPDEALLKRCSHFSTDMSKEEQRFASAGAICDHISEKRANQLDGCIAELQEALDGVADTHRAAVKLGLYEKTVKKAMMEKPLHRFLTQDCLGGDSEAAALIEEILAAAACTVDGKVGKRELERTSADYKKWKKLPFGTSDQLSVKLFFIRDQVTRIQALRKEVIGRVRSKRYFEAVRDFQLTTEDVSAISILSCCGHQGLTTEIEESTIYGKCIIESCRVNVSPTHIVAAGSLGSEASSGRYGIKLENLVNIIKNEIPPEDRILVFVQYDELLEKVQESLEFNKVPVAVLKGSAAQLSKTLSIFQDPESKKQKVLLLVVTDSSASGANLTVANHAIFVSPLCTSTTAQYVAFETQAIGRVRRYGQLKPVTIYRLLTRATRDVEIFEARSGRNVAEILASQDYRPQFIPNSIAVDPRPTKELPKKKVEVKKAKKVIKEEVEKEIDVIKVKIAPVKDKIVKKEVELAPMFKKFAGGGKKIGTPAESKKRKSGVFAGFNESIYASPVKSSPVASKLVLKDSENQVSPPKAFIKPLPLAKIIETPIPPVMEKEKENMIESGKEKEGETEEMELGEAIEESKAIPESRDEVEPVIGLDIGGRTEEEDLTMSDGDIAAFLELGEMLDASEQSQKERESGGGSGEDETMILN